MIVLICLGILITSIWSIVRTCRMIDRKPHKLGWWMAFALLALTGALLGVWMQSQSWQISSNIRFIGLPIPATSLTFEESGWTDSSSPAVMQFAIKLINVVACAAFALVPLMVIVRVGKTSRPSGPKTSI